MKFLVANEIGRKDKDEHVDEPHVGVEWRQQPSNTRGRFLFFLGNDFLVGRTNSSQARGGSQRWVRVASQKRSARSDSGVDHSRR